MKNLAIMVALLATAGNVLAQDDGEPVANTDPQTKMRANGSAVKAKSVLHKEPKGHRARGKRMK